MCIAYAPRVPAPNIPWLIELDPTNGSSRAYLADRDGNVLNVAKRHAPEARHASLDEVCRVFGLHRARDLELRWWDGADLVRVVRVELMRLEIRGEVRLARPGVHVRLGDGVEVHLPSAFALRRWSRGLRDGCTALDARS
jgi:hypothetical protein